MALTVDPNTDAPGDDDELVDPSRAPVQTPGTSNKFFTTDTEEKLYEENKKLHTVLRKLDNFLLVQHPELLRTMQKMSLFDETASDLDMEPGSSHPTSTRTANTTAGCKTKVIIVDLRRPIGRISSVKVRSLSVLQVRTQSRCLSLNNFLTGRGSCVNSFSLPRTPLVQCTYVGSVPVLRC